MKKGVCTNIIIINCSCKTIPIKAVDAIFPKSLHSSRPASAAGLVQRLLVPKGSFRVVQWG